MDYVLILLAVLCYTVQFASTKVYQGAVKRTTTTTLVMLIAISVIGVVICLCYNGFGMQFSNISVFWAFLFALMTIPFYMLGIKVLSMGSLAIYSMFLMLGGMLIPFFYGVLFLNETPSVGKILGTVSLTAFIILQSLTQKTAQPKEKTGKGQKILFLVLCLAIFVINGVVSVIVKAHQMSDGAVNAASFTILSCTITGILSGLLLLISFFKHPKQTSEAVGQSLRWKPLGIMAMIGFGNYIGNLLHLTAASTVPASVQFPLVSGGAIVFSALASVSIFREKLSRMEWIAIAGAFASTVLFAF